MTSRVTSEAMEMSDANCTKWSCQHCSKIRDVKVCWKVESWSDFPLVGTWGQRSGLDHSLRSCSEPPRKACPLAVYPFWGLSNLKNWNPRWQTKYVSGFCLRPLPSIVNYKSFFCFYFSGQCSFATTVVLSNVRKCQLFCHLPPAWRWEL